MIYSANLSEMINRIKPHEFAVYLKNTGWRQFQSKRIDVLIYQKGWDTDFYQVIIPVDKNLGDYEEAMYRSVKTVAESEGKPIEQVMLYLLNPNTDILKIRLVKSGIEAGSIFFDDAIRLYGNTKKLLEAAALDILHPQKYHQGRTDDSVLNFLSNCKFGQTEIGSYVVSVVCPFSEPDENEEYEQLSMFSKDEQYANSLARRVTNRVMENLTLIKNRIDDGNIDSLATQEGEKIISANFYEALNGLNLKSEDASVEFVAEWSPVIKNGTKTRNKITLTHEYSKPIETVISQLKSLDMENQKDKLVKIIGKIKNLDSTPDLERRTKGKIKVVYLDNINKRKVVTAELNKNEYDIAINAHACGSYVEIIGHFNSDNHRSILCDSFNVI